MAVFSLLLENKIFSSAACFVVTIYVICFGHETYLWVNLCSKRFSKKKLVEVFDITVNAFFDINYDL